MLKNGFVFTEKYIFPAGDSARHSVASSHKTVKMLSSVLSVVVFTVNKNFYISNFSLRVSDTVTFFTLAYTLCSYTVSWCLACRDVASHGLGGAQAQ